MGRNYLAHHAGDAVNAVLAAAGYNFDLVLRWLELLLSKFLAAQKAAAALQWVSKSKTSRTTEALQGQRRPGQRATLKMKRRMCDLVGARGRTDDQTSLLTFWQFASYAF